MVLISEAYIYNLILKDLALKNLISELPYFSPIAKPHKIILPSRRVLGYAELFPLLKKLVMYIDTKSTKNLMPDFLSPIYDDTNPPPDFLPPPGLKGISALMIYDSVTHGFNSAFQIAMDVPAAYSGSEERYPFFDRRIIDFMLSLPPNLCFRNGYSRYILRQAMMGWLPEKIRWRVSKATINELIQRGMQDKERIRIHSLIDDSIAVKLGLVNADRLLKAWKSFWAGERIPTYNLTLFLCAESWLRHQEKIRKGKQE